VNKKNILVLGAGGFIGNHLVAKLKKEGHNVQGIDLVKPDGGSSADIFNIADLSDQEQCNSLINENTNEVYQLAADMGGAGYIFTGENDADIMSNSAMINLNVLSTCRARGIDNILYTSSACIYPEHNQLDPDNPKCVEHSAYPANPDSDYGWEKLFSERLYLAHNRNHGMNCKIVRLHNVFGPVCAWNNGKEKSPAALCRKVALASNGDTIDVWGDGLQTRSFLYIGECLEGFDRIMSSGVAEPINLGSTEMISINNLVHMIADIADKKIHINNIPGPEGVRGRTSDNTLIQQYLGWKPSKDLYSGMEGLYRWIETETYK